MAIIVVIYPIFNQSNVSLSLYIYMCLSILFMIINSWDYYILVEYYYPNFL